MTKLRSFSDPAHVVIAGANGGIGAALIDALLDDPRCARFFEVPASSVFAERTFHVGGGKLERPDRVVELKGTWHVIDFKTGAERDRDKRQVVGYCEVLKAMHPNAPVQGWLLYTERLQLVEAQPAIGAL